MVEVKNLYVYGVRFRCSGSDIIPIFVCNPRQRVRRYMRINRSSMSLFYTLTLPKTYASDTVLFSYLYQSVRKLRDNCTGFPIR